MILYDITNLQKHSSVPNLNKIQNQRNYPLEFPQAESLDFVSILKLCKQSITHIFYPYCSNEDSLYISRNVQIEWMFSIQNLLNIDDDTLFQAILYFDKYISLKWKQLSPASLAKVAATCFILSSKINKLNNVSRRSLSSIEYVELETEILHLFEFQLPHTTVFQMFKLYQSIFQVQNLIKKDAVNFILKKCILDLQLLKCGIQATALSALNYLCKLKRVGINTVEQMQGCQEYSKALIRMNDIIKDAKRQRHTLNPQTYECT